MHEVMDQSMQDSASLQNAHAQALQDQQDDAIFNSIISNINNSLDTTPDVGNPPGNVWGGVNHPPILPPALRPFVIVLAKVTCVLWCFFTVIVVKASLSNGGRRREQQRDVEEILKRIDNEKKKRKPVNDACPVCLDKFPKNLSDKNEAKGAVASMGGMLRRMMGEESDGEDTAVNTAPVNAARSAPVSSNRRKIGSSGNIQVTNVQVTNVKGDGNLVKTLSNEVLERKFSNEIMGKIGDRDRSKPSGRRASKEGVPVWDVAAQRKRFEEAKKPTRNASKEAVPVWDIAAQRKSKEIRQDSPKPLSGLENVGPKPMEKTTSGVNERTLSQDSNISEDVCVPVDEKPAGGLNAYPLLPCGHRFHRCCLEGWLERRLQTPDCPVCRTSIDEAIWRTQRPVYSPYIRVLVNDEASASSDTPPQYKSEYCSKTAAQCLTLTNLGLIYNDAFERFDNFGFWLERASFRAFASPMFWCYSTYLNIMIQGDALLRKAKSMCGGGRATSEDNLKEPLLSGQSASDLGTTTGPESSEQSSRSSSNGNKRLQHDAQFKLLQAAQMYPKEVIADREGWQLPIAGQNDRMNQII